MLRLLLLACAGVVMQLGWVDRLDAQLPPDPRQRLHLRLPGHPAGSLGQAAGPAGAGQHAGARARGPGPGPGDAGHRRQLAGHGLRRHRHRLPGGDPARSTWASRPCAARVLVVVAFEVVFQVTLFLTPGLFTTDIFSYVMYGHISAIYNLNPYIYPPNYFPNNPLLNGNWIHPIWWDQPSVYGPLWTDIGWLMARLTAPLARRGRRRWPTAGAPDRPDGPGLCLQAADERRAGRQPGAGVVAARAGHAPANRARGWRRSSCSPGTR